MAEIKPFRAWRYNKELGKNISRLISPLFDVVTRRKLEELYQDPLNSIHLSVPNGGAGKASETLRTWKSDRIIVLDELPGIYVYYQYYADPTSGENRCRKGFVANVKVHEWTDKVILHHENTIPGSVSDRLEILSETGFHASATHGLYSDPQCDLETYMDEAIALPIYDITTEGIREVVGVIQDYSVIQKFITLIRDKQIILADGHHRYEASIQHFRNRKAKGDLTPEYHLMYLSNTRNDGITILPTHRLLTADDDFQTDQMLEKLQFDFSITKLNSISEGEKSIASKPASFAMITGESVYHLDLKPGKAELNPWPFPQEILNLDLTILHYFVIEKVFGIPGAEQRRSGRILFERNPEIVEAYVKAGTAKAGFLTRPITVDQVMSVCASGYTLPQKSTWFYPKLSSGLFFSSIAPGETRLPEYVQFQ